MKWIYVRRKLDGRQHPVLQGRGSIRHIRAWKDRARHSSEVVKCAETLTSACKELGVRDWSQRGFSSVCWRVINFIIAAQSNDLVWVGGVLSLKSRA